MGHHGEVTSIIELTQSNKGYSGQPQGQGQGQVQADKCLLLCSTGEDATVRVWSPVGITGRMISVLRGHTNNVMCVIELLHPTTYPAPPSTGRSSLRSKGNASSVLRVDSRKGSHHSRDSGSIMTEGPGLGEKLEGEVEGVEGEGLSEGVGGSEAMSTGRRFSQSIGSQDMDRNQGDLDLPAEDSEVDDVGAGVRAGDASSVSASDVHGVNVSGSLSGGRGSVSKRSVHVSLYSQFTNDRNREHHQPISGRNSDILSHHSNNNHSNNNHSNHSNHNHHSGRHSNRNPTPVAHPDELALAQMHTDGYSELICSGSYDRTLRVWHWPTGRCLRVLHVGKCVHAITQLRNGRISVAGDDNIIQIWNWVSGVCEMSLEGHSNYVRALVQLSDGRLCSGSMDNNLKLWK